MKNIVIIGSSGHAKVIVDIIEQEKKYNIIGFIDSLKAKGQKVLGYEVLGNEDMLPSIYHEQNIKGTIVAIGDNYLRFKVVQSLKSKISNLSFVTAVHPSATISKDVVIGQGTVIMAGVNLNTSCKISDFCILNTNSSLDHDSIMYNYSSLAPGVCAGGNCSIGEFSSVGIGSILKHGIEIEEHSVIGAGSLILKNVEKNSLYFGSPAKKVRSRKVGEKYL